MHHETANYGGIFGVMGYWLGSLLKFLPPITALAPAIITSVICASAGYITVEILKKLTKKIFKKKSDDLR